MTRTFAGMTVKYCVVLDSVKWFSRHSSMDQQLLQPLTALENSLTALVQSLTNSNTFAAAPHAASDLAEADDALVSSLLTLQTHQKNYATILRLRAEAETLQSNLHDILQTCADFRRRLDHIDPQILEEDEDENEEEEEQEIDYETLITFATRIGRHNNIAAYEAERRAEEIDLETKQKRARSKSKSATPVPHLNGTQTHNGNAQVVSVDEHQKQSEVVRTTIAATNQRATAYRQYTYAPFPVHEHLRWGELGRLQIVREQRGEEAVEAQIERTIREQELRENIGGIELDLSRTDGRGQQRRQSVEKEDGTAARGEARVQQVSRPAVKLDLDFPGGDSDGEDEDD